MHPTSMLGFHTINTNTKTSIKDWGIRDTFPRSRGGPPSAGEG